MTASPATFTPVGPTVYSFAPNLFYSPVILGRSTDPHADLKRADELASHALALDANYSPANHAKGDVLRAERRFNDAIAAYERALALNPNNAATYGSLADTYRALGQYEKAIEFYDKAIRFSPRDPLLFAWYCHKGDAYFGLQQYDQAIEWVADRSQSIRIIRQRIATSLRHLH